MLAKQRRIDQAASLVRVIFGVIWLVDASFKWLPAFRAHYIDLITRAAEGQPGWLQPWFHFWQWLFSLQPTAFAYVLALVETYIALAVLLGFARKVTYLLGVLWSILIWATAEGFGKPDMVRGRTSAPPSSMWWSSWHSYGSMPGLARARTPSTWCWRAGCPGGGASPR